METQLDYFDAWTNTQKAFMGNILNAQKQMRSHWMNTLQKMQETINELPGVQENAPVKEALNLYNPWFNTMLNTTKVLGDEALKVQETLSSSLEKQVEISRELVSSLSDLAKPAQAK
jgi:hypothetical protein